LFLNKFTKALFLNGVFLFLGIQERNEKLKMKNKKGNTGAEKSEITSVCRDCIDLPVFA
jgi:hypothetical protein